MVGGLELTAQHNGWRPRDTKGMTKTGLFWIMQAQTDFCASISACAGVAGSGQYESWGVPLTEGGLRYAIHPVTGQLLTSEAQPVRQDMPTAAHKAHREDRTIIKACR